MAMVFQTFKILLIVNRGIVPKKRDKYMGPFIYYVSTRMKVPLKVSKFQNESIKSSHYPKYGRKI